MIGFNSTGQDIRIGNKTGFFLRAEQAGEFFVRNGRQVSAIGHKKNRRANPAACL